MCYFQRSISKYGEGLSSHLKSLTHCFTCMYQHHVCFVFRDICFITWFSSIQYQVMKISKWITLCALLQDYFMFVGFYLETKLCIICYWINLVPSCLFQAFVFKTSWWLNRLFVLIRIDSLYVLFLLEKIPDSSWRVWSLS